MSNFTSANPSWDAALSAWGQYGGMDRFWAARIAAGTTALATCGSVSAQRPAIPFTVPTVGAGIQGYCLTMNDIYTNITAQYHTVLEYSLGTITLNGNVFSGSATMPTKTVLGTSLQMASNLAFLAVTTAGVATTPTITITYTNQDGVANQTATLVLPSSPLVTTAFFINPHLANGDSGIRTVTNISSSVTTGAAIMQIYGCLVLGHSNGTTTGSPHGSVEPLITPTLPVYLCAAGDAVNVYATTGSGNAVARDIYANWAFCPEPT